MPPRKDNSKTAKTGKAAKAPSQKKVRRTQSERTAESDSRMFKAAIELIGEVGTHNVTLKDVGERAGYSRGLAGSRFGSREALFSSLVGDFNARWAGELERFIGGRTGLSAFLAALDAVESFLIHESQSMTAMYTLWYESISSHSDLRYQLAEYHAVYRRDVERWISDGIAEGFVRPYIAPKLFAVQFCSFIFGTIYQWLVNPQAIDISSVFQDYRKAVLESIIERRKAR